MTALSPVASSAAASSPAPVDAPLPLAGLRIVEVTAFIAAPLGGMTLAQLGAEVIRIDPIGGNIDIARWPLSPEGTSLYWTGLNKAKRSVTLNLASPEGQALAADLITAPGEGGGILLTNLPASGWMSHAALAARRPDLITLKLTGNPDGSAAVDYTVNSASGFPHATGAEEAPVNHVLPAWDIAAGLYLATGLMAAERVRSRTGRGQEVTLSLADVMLASVGNLGYIADVAVNGAVRGPLGNHLYGAYGSVFATADGRHIMLVAISNRQWRAIGTATGLTDRLAMIGPLMDVDMTTEGGRFAARHAIDAVIAPWVAARSLAAVKAAFAGSGVLYGAYQDFGQLVAEDARCSLENPLFQMIDQPGVGRVLAPGLPLGFTGTPRLAKAAPVLGADTGAVLAGVLGLDATRLADLTARGIIR